MYHDATAEIYIYIKVKISNKQAFAHEFDIFSMTQPGTSDLIIIIINRHFKTPN